jgi:1-acyl-sn-glycerol-3-phosphate acyltransferase
MTAPGNHFASLIASVLRAAVGAQVTWAGSQPECRQRIYYANHSSHLDFIVLWAALPESCRNQTRPVAAKDYWSRGRLRRCIATRLFHAVLIDRPMAPLGGRESIEPLVSVLDAGGSLILFPEGTRGTGDQIGPFKAGIYQLCRFRPGLQLVPAYLENLNRILPKGEVIPIPLLSRVIFGPPLELEEAEPKDEFLKRTRAALCALQQL